MHEYPGKKLGFSGGFYLRVFPEWFIEKMIWKRNKGGNLFLSIFIPGN
jgi:hypothetical protein